MYEVKNFVLLYIPLYLQCKLPDCCGSVPLLFSSCLIMLLVENITAAKFIDYFNLPYSVGEGGDFVACELSYCI